MISEYLAISSAFRQEGEGLQNLLVLAPLISGKKSMPERQLPNLP
jgi:hypothetical protein